MSIRRTVAPQNPSARRWANVEFAAPVAPRPEISHVIFDFDGTLSLVREGWPDIMLDLFLQWLPQRPGETDAEMRPALLEDIMRLTGKPTIDQMILLAERDPPARRHTARTRVV